MIHSVQTLLDTERVAELFLKDLARVRVEGALVVGLSGDLGAGKTAFVKIIGKMLGVEEVIPSPTFVIMRTYETKNKAWKELVHIDAYRLENDPQGLASVGWKELVNKKDTLVCVEWNEFVTKDIQEPDVSLSLNLLPDGTRTIEWTLRAQSTI